MWYLVNLPGNKLNIAVRSEKNSIAADCLNKVCHDLGIICETDYFGLLYAQDSHNHSIKQWINLRNPLEKRHRGEGGPTMLELRVKFWVPAHLLLQESVREIFYMQARQMLLDGEIQTNNWLQAARVIALLSSAEGVRSLPDSMTETSLKVFKRFNQRAQRVKKTSRKTFVDEMNAGNEENEHSQLEKFIIENYVEHMMIPDDPETLINGTDIPDDFFLTVAREHQKINAMTPSSAKYWLLEEISTLKKFGEEKFEGTLVSDVTNDSKKSQHRNEGIQIAVSPIGLSVRRSSQNEAFLIPFSAVESAKSLRKCFHLRYLGKDFVVSTLVVKFSLHRIAQTLYRSLTEQHAFYSCETVHKNVETQFIRDLKGTIISMFNEDSDLGKKYVFDIKLTCRELYDNSRRMLHARGIDVSNHHQERRASIESEEDKRIDLSCIICMDRKIDTLFDPCRHLNCCRICAEKCELCPMCRGKIQSISVVYFT